jgi:hypothetical protein
MIPLSCKPSFYKTFVNGFQTPLKVYSNMEVFQSPLISGKSCKGFAPLFKILSQTLPWHDHHGALVQQLLLVYLIVFFY